MVMESTEAGTGRRSQLTTNVGGSLGSVIPGLSRFFCFLLGCEEETVSAEVARRANTTVQGAHTIMLQPFLKTTLFQGEPVFSPIGMGVRLILQKEAQNACAEFGPQGVDEMLRWIKGSDPGARQARKDLKAIKRACRRRRR